MGKDKMCIQKLYVKWALDTKLFLQNFIQNMSQEA